MSGAVGFIGLGIMGEGMAARLLAEGVAGEDDTSPLVIWNRTGSKCTAFKEAYPNKSIIIKDTPKEVIEACAITYSMMSTPEASRAVFEGEDGVLTGVTEGKSIVDCATLAEEDMQRMNACVLAKAGYGRDALLFVSLYIKDDYSHVMLKKSRFLEAPVSGSKGPAAQGTLIFLCAGNSELYDDVKDNGLIAMGKASYLLNEQVGYGTRAKLVVNSIMGAMLAAFGEGLALSESVGLDPNTMIEVIGQSAVQSPMYSLKGPKMVMKDHTPNFPLRHAHKDMALATEMAQRAGVEFSVIAQAEKVYRDARDDEELNVADEDFSAVYEKIHKDSTSAFSKKRRLK